MFKDLPTTFQGLHSIFKDHLLYGNSGGVGEEVGGGGGHQFLTNMENPRRWGGGGVLLSENPFVVGYGYFHLKPLSMPLHSKLKKTQGVAQKFKDFSRNNGIQGLFKDYP